MGIGREFMRKTQYAHLEPSDQNKGLPQPPLTRPGPPDACLIDLPEAPGVKLSPLDFVALVRDRETLRKYAEQPLTLAELSFLLWSTQGIRRVQEERRTYRTVPSAGARHAFETIILANRVQGLTPGLYRYLPMEHNLLPLATPERVGELMVEYSHNQRQVVNAAATFLWVADAYRMKWRYTERGYRYLHLDAGHVCQNLYLAAEAINSGVCAIAAFDDEKLNALLGLDGGDHFVVYLATVGKRE